LGQCEKWDECEECGAKQSARSVPPGLLCARPRVEIAA
jgi:hypothetical protein